MKVIADLSATAAHKAGAAPAPAAAAASGGTETVIAQGGRYYRVHTFLTSGTLTVTRGGAFEALLVAGGGPGGASTFGASGGGSAGDVIAQAITLAVGTHAITVGEGGTSTDETTRIPGGNTTAFGLTARGGGPGASRLADATDGGAGSHGRAAGALHPTEYTGGDGTLGSTVDDRAGGGGRGSGGNGVAAADGKAGDGGPATSSDINGTSTDYGRGGGGGRRGTTGKGEPNGAQGSEPATAGLNPGDGGGGGSSPNGTLGNGGSGANGIVIIRSEITEADYLEAA